LNDCALPGVVSLEATGVAPVRNHWPERAERKGFAVRERRWVIGRGCSWLVHNERLAASGASLSGNLATRHNPQSSRKVKCAFP